MAARTRTVQATASADIKAVGGPAAIVFITISNNGTVGTAGEVELRDAVSPAGNTGTLRWSTRFLSSDEQSEHYYFGEEGVDMPDGVRLVLDTVTNLIVTVGLRG